MKKMIQKVVVRNPNPLRNNSLHYQSHNNDLLKSPEEEKEKYLSNGLQPHCDYQQCLGMSQVNILVMDK